MAYYIPQTEQEFMRMDMNSRDKLKQTLLRKNFSKICNSLSTETLNKFSRLLHIGDMEELMLRKKTESRASIISDLLLRIQRSTKAWWEDLESVLREENHDEIFFSMSPWIPRFPRAVPNQRPGDDDSGDGAGGGPCPTGGLLPCSGMPEAKFCPVLTAVPSPHPPYHKHILLAETRGFGALLEPICHPSHELLWRQLAEYLGLSMRDQADIKNQSQGKGVHMLLLDRVIQIYQDAATVDYLISALINLGEQGQVVIRKMEQQGMISPVERVGSEAGGDVVAVLCDTERAGGTSAASNQVPSPRQPSYSPNHNLSLHQPFKESHNKIKTLISNNDTAVRPESVTGMNSSREHNHITAGPSDAKPKNIPTTMNLLTENIVQENIGELAHPCHVEGMPRNISHESNADCSQDRERRHDSQEVQGNISPAGAITPLQMPDDADDNVDVDAYSKIPMSPLTPSAEPDNVPVSQQDIHNSVQNPAPQMSAVNTSSQATGTNPGADREAKEVNIHIYKAERVQITHTNKTQSYSVCTPGQGEECMGVGVDAEIEQKQPEVQLTDTESVHDESCDHPSFLSSQIAASSSLEYNNDNPESFHPFPWKTEAHETNVKQLLSEPEEVEEENTVGIVDLSTGRLPIPCTELTSEEELLQKGLHLSEDFTATSLEVECPVSYEEKQNLKPPVTDIELDMSGSSVDGSMISLSLQQNDPQQSTLSQQSHHLSQSPPNIGLMGRLKQKFFGVVQILGNIE